MATLLKKKTQHERQESERSIISETVEEDEGKLQDMLPVGLSFSDVFLLHECKGHEERPARVVSILNKLKSSGMYQDLVKLHAREATSKELHLVHSKGYVRKLNKIHDEEDGEKKAAHINKFTEDIEDIYMNDHTITSAKFAVGSTIEAVDAIVKDYTVSSALAIVRPPGHHAEAHCAQGFCIFNNVAIAAKHCTETLGLSRVLIVDWDVHHGNGTQRTFLKDDKVMYFSVHRHDFGRFYPHSHVADAKTVGVGTAAGTNINVAWNGAGMGDKEYLEAWNQVLMPIARQFNPEIVIVSAGFDAAKGDRMGNCSVTPDGYAILLSQLQTLASGKIVLVLEGGYDLESLSNSVAACTHQLQNRLLTTTQENYLKQLCDIPISASAEKSIRATVQAQKPYWCLN